MSTLTDLRKQMTAAHADLKAKLAAANSEDAKVAVLNQYGPKITVLGEKIADEQFLAAQRKGVEAFGETAGATNPFAGSSSFGVSQPQLRNAPPLNLRGDQAAELYDAAISGKSLTINLKAATAEADVAMSTQPQFILPPLPFRREPTRVLSSIPTSATTATEVDYYRATTAASAAAAVAEGAPKPQSNPVWTKTAAPVRKIAHYVEITDEALSDFAGFISVVQEELLAGLILAENDELLNGSGSGVHLTGLLSTSGILTRARGTDQRISAVQKAIIDIRAGAAFAEADTIIVNPTDWQSISLEQDANGRYYLEPGVQDTPTPRLWGVPVVVTTQCPVGTALVGAMAEAAVAYIRWTPRIDMANQGSTQFVNNTHLIRCEERLTLTVPRPAAIVKLTGL